MLTFTYLKKPKRGRIVDISGMYETHQVDESWMLEAEDYDDEDGRRGERLLGFQELLDDWDLVWDPISREHETTQDKHNTFFIGEEKMPFVKWVQFILTDLEKDS